MASVSEVVLKYGSKGASKAARADQKVRESVKETANTARSESGAIDRWMTQHKSAINKIGMATTAVMGAILSASPTLRAELDGIRLGFSLLADTIVRDVLPGSGTLSEAVIDLALAYREWDSPLRRVISGTVLLLGVLWPLVKVGGAVVGMAKSIAGAWATFTTFITSGTAAATAAAVAIGGLIGLLGVGILEVTGINDKIEAFGSMVGDALPGWVRDGMLAVTSFFLAPIATVGAAILGFVEGFLEGGLSEGIDQMVARTQQMMGIFKRAIVNTVSNIVGLIGDFGQAMINKGKALGQFLATGLFNAATGVWEKAQDIASGIVDRIPSVGDMIELGKDIINGLADGIKNAAGAVGDAAGDVAQGFRDRLPGSDAKTGPLSDFTDIPDIMINELSRVGDDTGRLEKGADSAASALRPPTSAPTGGRRSGETTIVFEPGAVVMHGGGDRTRGRETADKTAEELGKKADRRGI